MDHFLKFMDASAEVFAADESFQSYIYRRNEDDIKFWECFITSYPEKISDMKAAANLLSRLKFRPFKPGRHTRQAALDKLLASLPDTGEQDPEPGYDQNTICGCISGSPRDLTRLATAASVADVLLIRRFFLSNSNNNITRDVRSEGEVFFDEKHDRISKKSRSRLPHEGQRSERAVTTEEWDDSTPCGPFDVWQDDMQESLSLRITTRKLFDN